MFLFLLAYVLYLYTCFELWLSFDCVSSSVYPSTLYASQWCMRFSSAHPSCMNIPSLLCTNRLVYFTHLGMSHIHVYHLPIYVFACVYSPVYAPILSLSLFFFVWPSAAYTPLSYVYLHWVYLCSVHNFNWVCLFIWKYHHVCLPPPNAHHHTNTCVCPSPGNINQRVWPHPCHPGSNIHCRFRLL